MVEITTVSSVSKLLNKTLMKQGLDMVILRNFVTCEILDPLEASNRK